MKLIDLLVQELPKRGGWPEGSGFIAADEDGAIDSYVYKPELDTVSKSWVDNLGDGYHKYNVVNPTKLWDWDVSVVDRSQYESALAASKQVEWDGEGLPPVGCECEVKGAAGDDSWSVGEILSHTKFRGRDCAVFQTEEMVSASSYEYFRPIRTEADSKRDGFIDLLMTEWAFLGQDGEQAGELYDAIAAGKIPGIKLAD